MDVSFKLSEFIFRSCLQFFIPDALFEGRKIQANAQSAPSFLPFMSDNVLSFCVMLKMPVFFANVSSVRTSKLVVIFIKYTSYWVIFMLAVIRNLFF